MFMLTTQVSVLSVLKTYFMDSGLELYSAYGRS